MKPGPRIVLDFLTSVGGATERGCWWRQRRIAERTGFSVRTVQRHLSALEKDGHLRIQHRQATTNLYFVCNANLSGGHAKLAYLNYKTESKAPKESKQALAFPPRTITNEYGRTDLNPEWIRLTEVLRGAQDRIRRARNPLAYERAIIQREVAAFSNGAQECGSRRAGNGYSVGPCVPLEKADTGAQPQIRSICGVSVSPVLSPQKKPPDIEMSDFLGQLAQLAVKKRIGKSP